MLLPPARRCSARCCPAPPPAGDNYIVVYFNTSVDRTAAGEMAFKAQLYQTVMGEALEMKSDITHRRSTNNFGAIVWQYNEIW